MDHNLPSVNIKKLINDIKGKMGWTQARLAEELGVTPETISTWKSGKHTPNMAYINVMERINRGDIETKITPKIGDTESQDDLRIVLPIILTISKKKMLELVRIEVGKAV